MAQFLTRPRRTIVLIALVLGGLAAAGSSSAPLFDPDEGYYAATASETLRSHPFWDLHFNGAPRWEKPILSYALVEAAFATLGQSVFAARLPSALEGMALILLIGIVVGAVAGDRAGIVCASIAGTTLGVSIFMRVAHPEIAVVSGIVGTELLACWWLATRDRHRQRRLAVGMGFTLAYGVLAKGPVGVVLPALALAAALPFLSTAWAQWRNALADAAIAAAIAVALTVPWFAVMTDHYGLAFLAEALWRQNVGRYTTVAYGHRGSPFSLLVPALIGLLPWAALLGGAVGRLQSRSAAPREMLRIVMASAAVTSLAFYSLSSSKLASYALVCIPPMAVLIGLRVDEDWDVDRAFTRAIRHASLALLALAALVAALPFVASRVVSSRELLGAVRPDADVHGILAPVVGPIAAILVAAGAAGVLLESRGGRLAAIGAAGALLPLCVLAPARPVLDAMFPWQRFGEAIAARPGPVYMVGRRAPSLTFYAARPVTMVPDHASLVEALEPDRPAWLVTTRDDWERWRAEPGSAVRGADFAETRGRMALIRVPAWAVAKRRDGGASPVGAPPAALIR